MDKVQKIRNEVERLQNELIQERKKGYGSDVDDACILELQNVLTYIDILQEEPVSKDTPFEPIGIPADAVELASIPNKKEPTIPDIVDEHYWEMLGEEPATEDLEEAAKNYMRSQNPPIWGLYHGFKAGAKWQLNKIRKENEKNRD